MRNFIALLKKIIERVLYECISCFCCKWDSILDAKIN
jgi:hypothetical protein